MDVFALTMRLKEEGAAQVRTALDKLGKSFAGTTQQAQTLDSTTSSLTSAMKGLAAAMGAREFAQLSDSYTNIAARLSLVTKSTAEASALQNTLFQIAQQTRTPFDELSNLYLRTANSAEALGLTQEQVIQLTRTTAQAIALSGSTAAEAAAAVQQLGQAFGNGVLQAQEWNSLAEQTPRLARAIAESFGVTTAEFRKQVLAGNVASDALARAILNNRKVADEAAKLPVTIGGAFTQLRNETLRFVGELNKGTGAAQLVVTLMTWIRDNLPLIGAIIGTVTVAWVGYRAALLTVAAAKAAVAAATAIASGSIAKGAAVALGATAATFVFAETLTRLKNMMAEFETQATTTAKETGLLAVGFGGVNKEAKTTVELLIEMSKLRPLTIAESRQLAVAEADLSERLRNKNISLAQSVKLQGQLNEVLEARKTAQMSEAENLDLLRRMAPRAGTSIAAVAGVQVQPVTISPQVLRQMQAQAQGAAEQFSRIADTSFVKRINELAQDIKFAFGDTIGNALADGIQAAIEQKSIGAGFKALTQSLLRGLGDMMVQFGKASLVASTILDTIFKALAKALPGGAIVASLAMIAAGAALKGAAGAAFGGGGASTGGGGFSVPAVGSTASGSMTMPTAYYGPTSAAGASTIERVNPVSVTVIGPNDPVAQRQLQEFMRNAQRRGSA